MEPLCKLIIVDDEPIIREGLRDMVDWRDLGYEVTACLEDGSETIEFLDEHDVDVVLTDIMMDEVNGIEIAKHVREHHPDVQVVILSAYRDFEFARDAIRYHACHYLLKPVDFDELRSVFSDLRRELAVSPRGAGATVFAAARRQLFADIAGGRIRSRDELTERAAQVKLEFGVHTNPCALLLIAAATTANGNHVDSPAATPTAPVRSGVLNALGGACNARVLEPAFELGNRMIVLAVGERSSDTQAFTEALDAGLASVIDSLRSAFRVSISAEVLVVRESLSGLIEESISEIVEEALERSRHRIEPVPRTHEDRVMKRVLSYLGQHYSADISLADASARAYLSPVYFSRYFKEHTGITFTEYLAKLRVEKAIPLLRERKLKIREIGTKVGYPNPRYFARVFKKTTGYSPREYCIRVLAEDRK